MSRCFFVTGTDTDSGKTTIAAGLLCAAKSMGFSTSALKPVASGCVATEQGLRNSDALALWAQCTAEQSYAEVNPYAFLPAIAPHVAAEQQGVRLQVADLVSCTEQFLAKPAELMLIEGAGGWRVPLNAEENLAELAQRLALPVIVVVGVRLGCINHALLTVEAIERDGLVVAGWVANTVDPHMSESQASLQTLKARINSPCLGWVPHLSDASAEQVAAHLNLGVLGLAI